MQKFNLPHSRAGLQSRDLGTHLIDQALRSPAAARTVVPAAEDLLESEP